MSKSKSILILLPLLALVAVSSMNVNAQKGGAAGGKGGGGGGCKTPSSDNNYQYDPTTGISTQTAYITCNGVPMSGYHVTWWAFTSSTSCYITTTGPSCIGSMLSVQLYTDSHGYAKTTFGLTPGIGSWGFVGY